MLFVINKMCDENLNIIGETLLKQNLKMLTELQNHKISAGQAENSIQNNYMTSVLWGWYEERIINK